MEEVLYQIPEVLETAVYGVPHKDLGEEIAAVVVLKEGARIDAKGIQAYVIKERVAQYKHPRIIKLVQEVYYERRCRCWLLEDSPIQIQTERARKGCVP